MSTPYLGEVRIVSFNFAPRGWAACNGQLLSINQNQALFAILGTTYGGNGVETFALPNLQGCTPMHFGPGFNLGQVGGEATHTLNISEIPAHTHTPQASSAMNTLAGITGGNRWGASGANPYAATSNAAMLSASIQPAGGGQPHENMPPYLVLNFIIALEGIFPTPN